MLASCPGPLVGSGSTFTSVRGRKSPRGSYYYYYHNRHRSKIRFRLREGASLSRWASRCPRSTRHCQPSVRQVQRCSIFRLDIWTPAQPQHCCFSVLHNPTTDLQLVSDVQGTLASDRDNIEATSNIATLNRPSSLLPLIYSVLVCPHCSSPLWHWEPAKVHRIQPSMDLVSNPPATTTTHCPTPMSGLCLTSRLRPSHKPRDG